MTERETVEPEPQELPVADAAEGESKAEADAEHGLRDHNSVQAPPEPPPDDFRPSGADLVISEPEEVFAVLDRHDEDQILQELQHRMIEEYVYDFPIDGKRQVDLSYKGVRDVTGLMNRTGKCKLRIIPASLRVSKEDEQGELYYRAEVWAEDLVTGATYSGLSYEPRMLKLKKATAERRRKDGKPVTEDDKVWDVFAETKAANKAERNALDKFIPEQIRQTLIAQYLGDPARVKRIQAGAGAEKLAELPPPLTDEQAEALRNECRETFSAIRAIHPTKYMLPGQFNALLIQHEWSHERLEEFKVHLAGVLERAQAEAE